MASGAKYVGSFQNGKYQGAGRYTRPDGSVYEGHFHHNQFDGTGREVGTDGSVYVGEHRAGKRNGLGKMTWPSGQVYEGGWVDDQWFGHGQLQLKDGSVYDGEFVDGQRAGRGTLQYANGNKYSGDFDRGQPNGVGTFWYTSGEVYTGEVKNGSTHGQGKSVFKSGDWYEGETKDGTWHGWGVYSWTSSGQWSRDLYDNGKKIRTSETSSSHEKGISFGQLVAGVAGVALVGATQGIDIATKARLAGSYLSDVTGDGKGTATVGTVQALQREGQVRQAEIQARLADARQRGEQAKREQRDEALRAKAADVAATAARLPKRTDAPSPAHQVHNPAPIQVAAANTAGTDNAAAARAATPTGAASPLPGKPAAAALDRTSAGTSTPPPEPAKESARPDAEDADGCIEAIGWCSSGPETTQRGSTTVLSFRNTCPFRVYGSFFNGLADGRVDAGADGVSAGKTKTWSSSGGSGKSFVRVVGSTRPSADWTCAAKFQGFAAGDATLETKR